MKRLAIIVAGGSGTRFGGQVPKQFMPLAGRAVLLHTLDAFAGLCDAIVVTLPQGEREQWHAICRDASGVATHTVVDGGSTRWNSVKNALAAVTQVASATDLVAIHDGVRPLVSRAVIEAAFAAAERHGAAIPAVPVTDSVRRLAGDGTSEAVPRGELRAVQTPQCFAMGGLLQAYDLPCDPLATDDAMTYERTGRPVTLIDGDPENIKITRRADLEVAEAILRSRQ